MVEWGKVAICEVFRVLHGRVRDETCCVRTFVQRPVPRLGAVVCDVEQRERWVSWERGTGWRRRYRGMKRGGRGMEWGEGEGEEYSREERKKCWAMLNEG